MGLKGVGKTALGVAYVRAWESTQIDRLFADPYALAFALANSRTSASPAVSALAGHVVLRTRFFDDYLQAAGCDQIVLVAAGLDTRAYRLDWPPGTRLFELDQPEVLDFKQRVLDGERAVPRCERHAVAVDLRTEWAPALLSAGFDPARRTAWLVEGLLIYLTLPQAEALLTVLAELSAPDSRLSFEDSAADAETLARAQHEYAPMFQGGLGKDAMPWLAANGWEAQRHERSAVAETYGRTFPGLEDKGFLTARRV